VDDKRKEQEEKRIGFEPPDVSKEKRAPDQNEGEGSKSADERYREGVREFEEQHDVETLARSARREVEQDPDTYRKAEEEGKRHAAEEDRELYKKE
jgi:hypothetical protein